jgi:hypothetical protein
MIARSSRILTVVSCAKMHDHGAISARWVYEDSDPFALTIEAEGTNQFWQIDRIAFGDTLVNLMPGIPQECGVVSLQMRASNPYALSLRFTEHTEYGERKAYLICNVIDVAEFLENVHKIAPHRLDPTTCGVDEALERIFTS